MDANSMTDGIFIALEGIDGSGTTTHTKLLSQWLAKKGLEVVQTHEPTNYRIGRLLREILRDTSVPPAVDALLFAADRVDHTIHRIQPALDQGKIVITDRYIESSIAYQSSSGLEREWVQRLNQYALKPNLTILLDVPPEVALRRKRKPRLKEKFEQTVFLKKVRQIFLDRAKEEGFTVLNAELSIKEVQNQIQKQVEPLLRSFK
ncbi:MAG: dTMP kinase [Promethearchaeota archaeon]